MDKYVELKGGLDLQTPPIAVDPGMCRDVVNMYESVNGGYTTIKGYERFDGGVLPSESVYYVCRATRFVGNQVDDATQLPLSVALDLGSEFLGHDPVNGNETLRGDILYSASSGTDVTFVLLNPSFLPPLPAIVENIYAMPSTLNQYQITSMELAGGPSLAFPYETFTAAGMAQAALDFRRADTRSPKGLGDVTGVHQIKEHTIAWRNTTADNTGDATLSMITDGVSEKNWVEARVVDIIVMNDATATKPASAVYGTASGDLTGAGAGWRIQDGRDLAPGGGFSYTMLVPTAPVGFQPPTPPIGTILQNAAGDVFGVVYADGTTFPWVPSAGGKLSAFDHNFYAGIDTKRVYMTDGVNAPMYFDPVTLALVPLCAEYNGLGDVLVAGHCVAFQSRLIFSTLGGGFITSVVGTPITIDGTLGSVEIGVGATVTGFQNVSAAELLIFTTGSTWSMSGADPSVWTLRQVTGDSGAKPFCTVNMGEIFAADDVGIVNVIRSDVLGGFTSSTVSNNVQSLYSSLDKTSACATVIKGLEQMRYYFSNTGLIATRVAYQSKNGNDSVRYGITRTEYPDTVKSIHTARRLSGIERTAFTSDSSYVYIMDSGTSFDGAVIDSSFKLAYNNAGSIWQRKRFEAITIETVSEGTSVVTMGQNIDDGHKAYDNKGFSINDQVAFGPYAVSGETFGVTKDKLRLKGSGFNVQFEFSKSSSTDTQVTFAGYTLRYTPRGLVTI